VYAPNSGDATDGSSSESTDSSKQKKRGHRKAQDIPSGEKGRAGVAAVDALAPGALPPATAEELSSTETEGVCFFPSPKLFPRLIDRSINQSNPSIK
jgi:hypothetical protein